jgi:chromate reductase
VTAPTSPPFHLLAISGSLRRASINSGLLRAAAQGLPPGVTLEHADIGALPHYDSDLDGPTPPEPVERFRAQVAGADGLLIACPEYNYSFTGVLKNAVDWASRPRGKSALQGKVAVLLGAAGRSGSARAQLHLRQVLVETDTLVMPKPELLVAMARNKFDADGTLIDELLRAELDAFVAAGVAWMRRMNERQPV